MYKHLPTINIKLFNVLLCVYTTLVSSAGVYRFKAKPSIASVENKRHKETADRRKSYNAQNSAKKKPRAYKPYTGKMSLYNT